MEVRSAEAALERFALYAGGDSRDWIVVGTQWMVYDFEDSWAHGTDDSGDSREFWHLTWRTGPTV